MDGIYLKSMPVDETHNKPVIPSSLDPKRAFKTNTMKKTRDRPVYVAGSIYHLV